MATTDLHTRNQKDATSTPLLPELATGVVDFQQQFQAQEQETKALHQLICEENKGKNASLLEGKKECQPDMMTTKPPEPTPAPPGPQEQLYDRFNQMHPIEFEGLPDFKIAENWLCSVQSIFDRLNLVDHEKIWCATRVLKKDASNWWDTVVKRRNIQEMTWTEFIEEFSLKYYSRVISNVQYNGIKPRKSKTTNEIESAWMKEHINGLYSFLLSSDKQHVKLMRNMFRPELANAIGDGKNLPISVVECIVEALQAESHLARKNQSKERKLDGQNCKTSKCNGRKKKKRKVNPKSIYPICSKCERKHLGECLANSSNCFYCGMEGHFLKDCHLRLHIQSFQQSNQENQLHATQGKIEDLSTSHDRCKVP